MMDYIVIALVASMILIIFTLTACICRVLIALSKRAITILCGAPEKKENKIIEFNQKSKAKRPAKKTNDEIKEA